MTLDQLLSIWLQQDVALLFIIGLVSVWLWRVPIIGWLFYPFRLFVTYIHECAHGIAAVMTGGRFHRFVVHPSRSGVAMTSGGIRWVVLWAGYTGASLFGALLLILTTAPVEPQAILLWIGTIQAILCLLFVRNMFGIVGGLALAGAFFIAGTALEPEYATALLTLLSVQTILSAFDSIVDLIKLSRARVTRDIPTDAQQLARLTGLPAIVWALAWALLSLLIYGCSISLAYSNILWK